ncbi:hypothetical protein RhiirA1_475990 [Rhizophagus irregularis]|uniref:Uncharacterized protein n=1 Tax=Rhizophagus irregularis TaxID=588596 RepID=A0A2I1F4J6_9GLOM|nr:hypothetical protein RhiirA1_475990 [Rhizophagus irregularis]PKY29299.1 hypothetical protein RhiirB3_445876 [Rhizophagus irregularis]
MYTKRILSSWKKHTLKQVRRDQFETSVTKYQKNVATAVDVEASEWVEEITINDEALMSNKKHINVEDVPETARPENIKKESDAEPADTENEEEINNLTELQQGRDTQSEKDCLSSIHLNGILDHSDDEVLKKIKRPLNMDQITWLENSIQKKSSNY